MWPVLAEFFDLIDSLFPWKVVPQFMNSDCSRLWNSISIVLLLIESRVDVFIILDDKRWSDEVCIRLCSKLVCLPQFLQSFLQSFLRPENENDFSWPLFLSTKPLLLSELVIVISLFWLFFFNSLSIQTNL